MTTHLATYVGRDTQAGRGIVSERHRSLTAYRPETDSDYTISPYLSARSAEYQRVREWCEAGTYVCAAPGCLDPRLEVRATTVRRDGTKVAAHLRHRKWAVHSPAGRTGGGESSHHAAAKRHILDLGRGHGFTATTETTLRAPGPGRRSDIIRRPDIIWDSGEGDPWAIEIQFSAITTEDWRARTKDLRKLGCRPFWVWGTITPETTSGWALKDDVFGWRDKYRAPTDVWVVEVVPADGLLAHDAISVAQCHSPDWYWEAGRVRPGRRRPEWPNALEYDRGAPVVPSAARCFVCPSTDEKLAELSGPPGPARRAPVVPAGSDRPDRRWRTHPAVVAAMASSPPAPKMTWSRPCERCGQPMNDISGIGNCCFRPWPTWRPAPATIGEA